MVYKSICAASMRHGRQGRSRGFALLITLWMLVLIAFIVGYVTSTGRRELQISTNVTGNATASAAADGAAYRAIFALSDPRPDHRPAADGSIQTMQIGRSLVTVQVQDESGRINPNLAPVNLLEGLMRAVGTEGETAADLADGIAQWVGTAPKLRSADQLAAEYRAAGLDYAPPETPLESLDELLRVRGMTAEEFAAIRPHLTLFGGRTPNLTSADPVVAAAMRFANQTTDSGPVFSGIGADARVVRIRVSARGPGNAAAQATVIVRIGSPPAGGYSILEWDQGSE